MIVLLVLSDSESTGTFKVCGGRGCSMMVTFCQKKLKKEDGGLRAWRLRAELRILETCITESRSQWPA
jgi:hypothetical protein